MTAQPDNFVEPEIKKVTEYYDEEPGNEADEESRKDQDSDSIRIKLNIPQAKFLAMDKKFRAFVSGYGGGKTWVGCSSIAKHIMEFPRVNAGYFAPTYPQIRDIFYPTVEEALHPWGFDVKINSSNKEVQVMRGNVYYGTIICRSMDHPEAIVGFKIGHALVDEIDVMKMDKANAAWLKIVARLRYNIEGLKNGIDITTTPEGFRFVYYQFVERIIKNPDLAKVYGLVQASTYDNAKNLPADYIPSLLSTYSSQLIAAYINGQFVNLQTGTVYSSYDRELNDTKEVHAPGETLYIGMDFNVGKMAAITHVIRNKQPLAVDEIVNGYDTPDMIRRIKERYWKFQNNVVTPTCQIRIYPDASGDSRKSTNASTTDLMLLRQAGFQVVAERKNPFVKDRVNSMNAMFCNAAGHRRYKVNADKCPTYAGSLEKQPWDSSGEPDKNTGHDHTNDAGGYFIEHDFGIKKIIVRSTNMYK